MTSTTMQAGSWARRWALVLVRDGKRTIRLISGFGEKRPSLDDTLERAGSPG